MSRIGRKPVSVPANVKVAVADTTVHVEGPNGKLSFPFRHEVGVVYDEAKREVVVTRQDDERLSRALHGLTRSVIANMVKGVTDGYTKKLEIVGVGYQAEFAKAGGAVKIRVGKEDRSHERRCRHPRPSSRLRQQGAQAGPARAQSGCPRPDAYHHQRRGQAARRPVRRRSPRCAAAPSPTRARASVTRASSSGARRARLLVRNNPGRGFRSGARAVEIKPSTTSDQRGRKQPCDRTFKSRTRFVGYDGNGGCGRG